MAYSKYKTGLFFKACLYSRSADWIAGDVPGGKGDLVASLCINKATREVFIAMDRGSNASELLLKVHAKMDEGFRLLGVSRREQDQYQMLYQTPTGTTLMPSLRPYRRQVWWRRLGDWVWAQFA